MSSSISVVIPVFNRGPLVATTLDSVLSQTLSPLEILVVDDGSTDGSADWIEEHYRGKVRVIRQRNGGVARARNRGLEEARGEFIAFLDHDDVWLPDKLQKQSEAMRQQPDAGVVYCSWVAVDEAGNEMPPIIQFQRQWWWKAHPGSAFPWILLPHPLQFLRNPIISMTIPLIRTRLLRDIGGFDEKIVPSDDWDVWIRLAQQCEFAFVNEELALYVHHSGQQHKHMETAYASQLEICRKHRVSWTKHPYVRWKQECFKRTCRAMMQHADAQESLVRRDRKGIVVASLKAIIQRPDTLILRRWHRVWMRALKKKELS